MTMNSTISCIPSTLNFVCDVDGVHTEIPIPANAWDFENETVWLTQAQLEELYACSHANLVGHIGNIYDDEELQESSTCRKFRQVQLARLLLSHFATKLGKDSIPLPNGATYTDSFGRLQTAVSTYYERDVVDAVLDWVVENPNDFARLGGKRDPLHDEG